MQEPNAHPDLDARLLADLSALADGSLDPQRAEIVTEQIANSPELRERFEREQRAVSILHEVRDDRAPHSLRLAIDAHRRPQTTRRGRLFGASALAVTVSVVVAALVLLLPGGSPGGPSVSQAAALALRGSAVAPPAPVHTNPAKLAQDVQEVYFPNWEWMKWEASGRRIDTLAGRPAVTVYYTNTQTSRQIAYTIVGSPPLRRPGSRTLNLNGIQLQSFVLNGRLVVTWRRAGHTCVLSGSGMTVAQLARLAGWQAPGL
jgi:hypothetical protein